MATKDTSHRAQTAVAETLPYRHAGRLGIHVVSFVVRTVRLALSLALIALAAAFLVRFAIQAGIISRPVGEVPVLSTLIDRVVVPTTTQIKTFVRVQTTIGRFDFALLGLALVTLLVRPTILMPFDKADGRARSRLVRQKATGASAIPITVEERGATHRLNKLREYASAKQFLFQEKRRLAFLSIDVVGSTRMKVGEDKLAIEHAFTEYKKFVERILKKNNLWKVAWTPDGIMCAFFTTDDAVAAAQEVLVGLAWFNSGVHGLKTPFNVRCGVNAGEVVFPEDKAMEEIGDEAIDIAGHMQKYAAPGALWLAVDLLEELPDRAGFELVPDTQVDDRTPYAWRAPAAAGSGQAGHP